MTKRARAEAYQLWGGADALREGAIDKRQNRRKCVFEFLYRHHIPAPYTMADCTAYLPAAKLRAVSRPQNFCRRQRRRGGVRERMRELCRRTTALEWMSNALEYVDCDASLFHAAVAICDSSASGMRRETPVVRAAAALAIACKCYGDDSVASNCGLYATRIAGIQRDALACAEIATVAAIERLHAIVWNNPYNLYARIAQRFAQPQGVDARVRLFITEAVLMAPTARCAPDVVACALFLARAAEGLDPWPRPLEIVTSVVASVAELATVAMLFCGSLDPETIVRAQKMSATFSPCGR